MTRRQPLPRLWLMTDERQGEALWRALDRLPRGAGVVFRHHRLAAAPRRALFARVKGIARRKRLLLLLAGPPPLARHWGADGSHGPGPAGRSLRTASVHSIPELRAAEDAGAVLVFVSPVFPTRSHGDARTLGRIGLADFARRTRLPVIALGGITAARARSLKQSGVYGWAAIDAWSA